MMLQSRPVDPGREKLGQKQLKRSHVLSGGRSTHLCLAVHICWQRPPTWIFHWELQEYGGPGEWRPLENLGTESGTAARRQLLNPLCKSEPGGRKGQPLLPVDTIQKFMIDRTSPL